MYDQKHNRVYGLGCVAVLLHSVQKISWAAKYEGSFTHIDYAVDESLTALVVQSIALELLRDKIDVNDVLDVLRLGTSLRKILRDREVNHQLRAVIIRLCHALMIR
jgi:hypothetical protein